MIQKILKFQQNLSYHLSLMNHLSQQSLKIHLSLSYPMNHLFLMNH